LRNKALLRLLALLLAFALVAAACGDDDDDVAETDDTEEDGGNAITGDEGEEATEEEAPAEEEATEEEAPAEEEATEAPAEEGSEEEAPAGGGLADDAVDGNGAQFWESVYDAQPGAADESLEPVLITMTNVEGSPAGSFPDIREGALAAAKEINENLGGINGRPVELEVCVNGLDPNEATNCANEVADANPNLHIQGINFFNPQMWPILLGGDMPILQTVPIFISDFNTPGLLSTEGGCVNAFPGGAQYLAEDLQSDRVAVIHSDTGPGFECYQDTQQRFYQHYTDTIDGFSFQGFPDASGDPSDNEAVVQNVLAFLEGAENPSIYFGIQSSDCNEIMSSLAAGGNTATIVASGSCRDEAVLSNPAATGVLFGSAGKIFDRPDLWTEWETKTADARQAAIDAFGPEAPQSSFMEVSYDVMITAWVVLSQLSAGGSDLTDTAEIMDAFGSQDNLFRMNSAPLNCTDNGAEFQSVCNKIHNHYLWTGETWEFGPQGPDYLNVADLLAAVADTNPRPDAG
jgi:branched-chain amino acid transport system substrate-binding protein